MQHFEYLVAGHFRKRVLDILMACQAYTEGLEVGCYGMEVQEEGNSSIEFRNDVASCIKPLVDAFNKIGAKGASEFLSLSEKRTPLPDPASEKTPASLNTFFFFCFSEKITTLAQQQN